MKEPLFLGEVPLNGTHCVEARRVLVIDKVNRAGLSSRLWRLVEAMQVAMALQAALVLPSPCKCLGGHGATRCSGAFEWWDGYVDTEVLERWIANPSDDAWRPVCGGFLRRESPWPGAERVALANGKSPLLERFSEALSRKTNESVVYYLPNHKSLTGLLHRTHHRMSRPVTQNMLHAGDFPVGRELDARAADIVKEFFGDRPFFAVKVRRGDKLDRGFADCTDPKAVAKAVIAKRPKHVNTIFVMSDENDTSPWWSLVKTELLDDDDVDSVITELDTVRSPLFSEGLDNYAVYVAGLSIIKRSAGLLTTQNHDGGGVRGANFLCDGLYSRDHRPRGSPRHSHRRRRRRRRL